ncbi:MAG: ABC transporter permease, partial [Longimicrobiales bacterium]
MPSRPDRSVRIYRLLLRLFPRPFRDRWGEEMETLFIHRLDGARRGPMAQMRFWGEVATDSVFGAAYEWTRLVRQRNGVRYGSGMWAQDLRHALKGLAKTPGPTLLALVTLALGTGATTTTFSVVDGVMLEDLPYPDPDRIVSVWPAANFNVALVREFEDQVPALEAVAGISTWTAVLGEGGAPVELEVGVVSPSYFSILGIEPELGRVLLPEDDLQDRSGVVILSYALWSSRFGRDPDIVGRTVQLSVAEREVYSVVGVMPQHFQPLHDVVAWVPLVDDPTLTVANDPSWYVNSRIARVAPGATVSLASSQVEQVATRIAPEVPNQFAEEQLASAGVTPLKDAMLSESRRALWVLLGAVGLVLLIACANVANLLLARGESRRHDLAVRSAMGADRGQIVRLLLAEALLLSAVGGALGLSAAYLLTDVVIALAPAGIPRLDQVSVDLTVLAFAMAVTIATTLMSGLWPSLRTSRTAPANELGGSTRGSAGRNSSRLVSQGLIAAEIALAVIVALGSGLMLKSLDRMVSVDTGFEPRGVVAFRANPLGSGRTGAPDFRQFYQQVLDRIRTTPGVTAASAVQ